MDAKRVAIDTEAGNAIRGPWADPVQSNLPAIVPQTDPRLDISDQALVVASQNAFPVVANQKSRRDNLGLAAGGAIALVLGVATFMSLSSHRSPTTVPTATTQAQTAMNPAMPVPGAMPGRPIGAPMPPGAAPSTAPMPMPMSSAGGMPVALPTPGMSPQAAPVLVYDGGGSAGGALGGGGANAARADGAPGLLAGAAAGAGVAAAGDNNSARASRLANPATTVVQGTLVPAVLETAIDTDVPGFVRAVVSQDVRSFDGSRVLIPRSSRLIGEYKGATQAGQRRAYLMWTRLVRPDGVSVALASPASDFSGQAGVGGQVNSHFFSRFGSAILMSVLGGATQLVSGGASTVIVGGGQNAATAAIQQNGNRGPTIKVRQGEPIRVFTARDLVFPDGSNG